MRTHPRASRAVALLGALACLGAAPTRPQQEQQERPVNPDSPGTLVVPRGGERDPAKVFEPAVAETLAAQQRWALALVQVEGATLPRQTREPGERGFTYHVHLGAIRTLAGEALPEELSLYATLEGMPERGAHGAVLATSDGTWHLVRLVALAKECPEAGLLKAAKAVEARLAKR